MEYHTKWTKKDDWEITSLNPGTSQTHLWCGFFKMRPEIRFDFKKTRGAQIVPIDNDTEESKECLEPPLQIEPIHKDKVQIVNDIKERKDGMGK